jgi:hypothetical protein
MSNARFVESYDEIKMDRGLREGYLRADRSLRYILPAVVVMASGRRERE